jgi:hypothetical protein
VGAAIRVPPLRSTAVPCACSGTVATTGLLGTAAAEDGAGVEVDGGGVDDAVLPAPGVVMLTLAEYAFGLFGYLAMTWYTRGVPAGALASV